MYVPLGDGGGHLIFILTYAAERDVLPAASADLWGLLRLGGEDGFCKAAAATGADLVPGALVK